MKNIKNKKEILIYISTLLCCLLCFYNNILSNPLKIIFYMVLTGVYFVSLKLIYNNFKNTMKHTKLARAIVVIYLLSLIWIITNKINYLFFNEYINFARLNTTADSYLLLSSLKSIIYDLNFICLVVFISLNFYSFLKHNFKTFKKCKRITITLLIILFILPTTLYNLNDEVITHMFNLSRDVENEKEFSDYTIKQFLKTIKENENDTQKYNGIAKEKNVFLIQCESLQDVFLRKEYNGYTITPFLNELLEKDTIYFNNCYSQVSNGNTSDAEFVTNTSYLSILNESAYMNYANRKYENSLANILKRNGYITNVFHGYNEDMWNRKNMYECLGFDMYYSKDSFIMDEIIGLGVSDRSFFRQSIGYITEYNSPTFNFLITLSTHTPFNTAPSMSDIKLLKEDENSLFGKYIIHMNYLDSALNVLFNELKVNNLYDNSIIILYGDHQGLNLSVNANQNRMTKFIGKNYTYDDMLNVPLLIHIPNSNIKEEYSMLCSQSDILPTILNLLGIKEDINCFGNDLLNLKNTNRVISSLGYMFFGGSITDEYIIKPKNHTDLTNCEIIDRKTGLELDKDTIDMKEIENVYNQEKTKREISTFLIRNNK